VEAFASSEEFLTSDRLRDTRCLILDVRMPGMNGIELKRRLVASHREIPVIFITAHGDEAARSQALRDGAVAYLLKPFTEEALLSAIHAALKIEMVWQFSSCGHYESGRRAISTTRNCDRQSGRSRGGRE